ncbi:FUSC family protein [Streptomyces sp. CA-106110]|uniref:FUSC family protein n=1 Tax=Streptomyces sp. CA-106110 TaxID=3240044 RepID=UPI003D8AA033
MHGLKSLIAALLTWGITAPWFPGGRPYLAVATALLMVNASTVYRSVTKAVQSVTARLAGLSFALVTAWLFGSTAGSIAAVMVVAAVAGARRLSDDRLQIASTAIVTLSAAAAAPVGNLVSPAIETLTGAVVGIVVNALVLPPLYLDESSEALRGLSRAIGILLREMAAGLAQRQHSEKATTWLHEARELGQRMMDAWGQLQQAEESMRWNTRYMALARREDVPYGEAFRTLYRVSVQVRGIARTLADNAHDDQSDHHLGQQFLDHYAEALELAGLAIQAFIEPSPSAPAEGAPSRERLRRAIDGASAWHETMTDLIGRGALTKPGAWHVYGALMTDVERLLVDLDQLHRTRP